MTALTLALVLALAAQDDHPPPPTPPGIPAESGDDPPPLLASDGHPLAPGRIPADTSAAARERWGKVIGATGADALPPITSFDLRFEVEARRVDGFNKVDVGVAYLEADHARAPFLRLFLDREDLVSIHGPDGAWLIDGKVVQRMSGRDYAEDLRQLEQYRSLAQNLLALIQPARVRLVSLRALQVMPSSEAPGRVSFEHADPLDLPTEDLARGARSLEWVEVRSPDLRVHLAASGATERVYHGLLGLEGTSGEVRLAVLHEERPAGRLVPESALLVVVREYHRTPNGYRLPRDYEVREIAPASRPLTFEKRVGNKLWLLTGPSAINPPLLSIDAFRPR